MQSHMGYHLPSCLLRLALYVQIPQPPETFIECCLELVFIITDTL